jgi:hypothetical protein
MANRRRNRKREQGGFFFPAPLAVILGLLAVVLVFYICLCSRCEAIGQEIKALEKQKEDVHRRVLSEEYKWSGLKSPRSIERLLAAFNLEMSLPDGKRVVRLHYSPATAGLAQYAHRADRAPGARTVMND